MYVARSIPGGGGLELDGTEDDHNFRKKSSPTRPVGLNSTFLLQTHLG